GPTAHAVLARSLTEDVRPLERTRASLSPQVSAVVMRALARTPADRHATGEELVSALLAAEDHARTPAPTAALRTSPPRPRRQLATAAVAILALGALWMKLLGGGGAASDSSSKTVAVLPFENLGSSDDAYFADGMVEELRDKLARLAQLTVTASASSDLYRGTSKTATDIARELRVDQVLTGKVRWATGNDGARQVRVAAELIDGSTGKVTWRDTFDADMANAFEIQGRIATRVAAALGTLLAPKEAENLAGRPTQNAEAHEIFLKAAAITAQGMQGY